MQPWSNREELVHQVVTLERQGLKRRAIARALGVSRNTVRKILAKRTRARQEPHSALPRPPARAPRSSKLDEHRPRIDDLLARYPDITAQRVFEELCAGGYAGGATIVKDMVRRIRPQPHPEPSLPTTVWGPGKMAENDWSPMTIPLTTGERPVFQVFGYALCFSTRKYFDLFERADVHALMAGHVATFERFGGAAEECKYDCQKAVVLGWEGRQPIYNPRFLAFATYYDFKPRACRPEHPNDKPRVERSFWEFTKSFLNGRSFSSVADLRAQLAEWQRTICDTRPHKKIKRHSPRSLRRGAAPPAAAARPPLRHRPRRLPPGLHRRLRRLGRESLRRLLRARHRSPTKTAGIGSRRSRR